MQQSGCSRHKVKGSQLFSPETGKASIFSWNSLSQEDKIDVLSFATKRIDKTSRVPSSELVFEGITEKESSRGMNAIFCEVHLQRNAGEYKSTWVLSGKWKRTVGLLTINDHFNSKSVSI